MPSGGGAGKTTSSNPAWLDKAGEQLWGTAQNVFFGQPESGDYYDRALKPWGYSSPSSPITIPTSMQPSATKAPELTPLQKHQQDTFNNLYGTKSSPTPYGAGSASSLPSPTAATATGFGNIRSLPTYNKQRVSGVSPTQQTGIGIARDSIGISDPYFNSGLSSFGQATGAVGSGYDTGMGYLSSGAGYIPASTERYQSDFGRAPEAMGYYMDPFVKGSLDVSARELMTQRDKDVASAQQRAKTAGAFGGSRQAVMESEDRRNANQNLSDLYTKGLSDAFSRAGQLYQTDEQRLANQFNSEQDRIQQAADLFRQFGATGADIGYGAADRYKSIGDSYVGAGKARNDVVSQTFDRLMQAGGVEQSADQAARDFDYQQFIEQRDYPMTVMEQLAAILNGNPSRGSVTTTPKADRFGQILGAGATIGGGYLASDRRLKTAVTKVGDHEIDGRGVVGMYRFKYAGEDGYHTGVMAQEVEEIMPEAVLTGVGGVKMVDYGAIGAAFH